MADLRVFSYLPNPRLYKATIAARLSGSTIEVIGARPRELPGWLWDYDARELTDDDRLRHADWARRASTGFSGTLFKSDGFLAANPFGDVPTAFGAGGEVGLFESNSIMRAAARLGPGAARLCGESALEQSRIDGFLDRTLVFARDIQRYLLAGRALDATLHAETASSLDAYLAGVERALGTTPYLAGDQVTLADIAFACELCLLSNEAHMSGALDACGQQALLPRIAESPRVRAHLARLADDEAFSRDLGRYFEKLPLT